MEWGMGKKKGERKRKDLAASRRRRRVFSADVIPEIFVD
jgi:hypothetical protein